MATKAKQEDQELKIAQKNPNQTVHHLVRPLGAVNQTITTEMGDKVYPVDRVNADVQNWLDAGYNLHSTHYLGEVRGAGLGTPIVGYRILYIFIKDA